MSTSFPNIVFLDIDGVLCNPRSSLAVNDGMINSYFDPIACMLVKKLCIETSARIVISSSWKKFHDMDATRAILNAACPQLGNLMFSKGEDHDWKTPDHNGTDGNTYGRGREIEKWIKAHSWRFNRFVILDDDSDMDPLEDSLVQTDLYNGIGFFDFLKAKAILNGEEFDFPQYKSAWSDRPIKLNITRLKAALDSSSIELPPGLTREETRQFLIAAAFTN